MTLYPRDSPHSPKPVLEVRIMEPLSYLADTRVKNAVAAPDVGPDAQLIPDEDLGRQVHLHPPVQVVLDAGLSQIFHQIIGADEVGP